MTTVGEKLLRKPSWLKVRLPDTEMAAGVSRLMAACRLHTVCREARCPNMAECFKAGTAAFLILGDCCTRNCRYCNVRHGSPEPVDEQEVERMAEAVGRLGLSHAVITSVTRDDLPDGGAEVFVRCIRRIRDRFPACRVEVLVPDFNGSFPALQSVIAAKPAVFNHNIEVCRSLFPMVRPQGRYERSLEILRRAHDLDPAMIIKTGFMIGLGEIGDEITALLTDLRGTGCRRLTIGQYLQPSRSHWPVHKYYHPDEFDELRHKALAMGFASVLAGPLVRSSYHAAKMS